MEAQFKMFPFKMLIPEAHTLHPFLATVPLDNFLQLYAAFPYIKSASHHLVRRTVQRMRLSPCCALRRMRLFPRASAEEIQRPRPAVT